MITQIRKFYECVQVRKKRSKSGILEKVKLHISDIQLDKLLKVLHRDSFQHKKACRFLGPAGC
jgi:CRISPR/Cas system CSM-associated protein Csm2 small subunit